MLKRFVQRCCYVPSVRYCSQTLYQSAIGALRLYGHTGESLWAERACRAVDRLLTVQQPDGGFDIGYEFNFGRVHRKGESTAPELVGLIALAWAYRELGHRRFADGAHRAADWIRQMAVQIDDRRWCVPYGPYSTREVVVYNGTSFACGGLGVYLGIFDPEGRRPMLWTIYRGLVAYLDSVMSRDPVLPGRFWFYNDQAREDLADDARRKIDYYHQMQQVEVHALAQRTAPLERQKAIILDAADYVVGLARGRAVVPYTNLRADIPVWGLVSVAAGLLEAMEVTPGEAHAAYEALVETTVRWVVEHSWNGKFFIPVLHPDGSPLSSRYMVRSDAWVFAGLAAALCHGTSSVSTDILEACYRRMERRDFSGPESHATDTLCRVQSRMISLLKRLAGR